MISSLLYILFENYINILAWEMANPGNRHCASCIGARSFPVNAGNGFVSWEDGVKRKNYLNLRRRIRTHTHTHTHTFNDPLAGTIRVSRYQKGKTNLDFTEARYQLGHMQVCTSLQTDNHASTPSLSFLQAGCPSCRLTNSVKALEANQSTIQWQQIAHWEQRLLSPIALLCWNLQQ